MDRKRAHVLEVWWDGLTAMGPERGVGKAEDPSCIKWHTLALRFGPGEGWALGQGGERLTAGGLREKFRTW